MKTIRSVIIASLFLFGYSDTMQAQVTGNDETSEGCYDNPNYLNCIDLAAEDFYNKTNEEAEADYIKRCLSVGNSSELCDVLWIYELSWLKDEYERALADCLCHCEEGPSCE